MCNFEVIKNNLVRIISSYYYINFIDKVLCILHVSHYIFYIYYVIYSKFR